MQERPREVDHPFNLQHQNMAATIKAHARMECVFACQTLAYFDDSNSCFYLSNNTVSHRVLILTTCDSSRGTSAEILQRRRLVSVAMVRQALELFGRSSGSFVRSPYELLWHTIRAVTLRIDRHGGLVAKASAS